MILDFGSGDIFCVYKVDTWYVNKQQHLISAAEELSCDGQS